MLLPAHYRIQLRLTSDSEEDRASVPSSCSADRTKRDAGRLRLADRHRLDLQSSDQQQLVPCSRGFPASNDARVCANGGEDADTAACWEDQIQMANNTVAECLCRAHAMQRKRFVF
ncbi:hypothetical protein PVAP13_6KG065210 [Panicum virgatum]|uniref:Uncharacterized protein n=1 Tax=Panicum virgatum TaxID=38727 RepID=A0A8T0RA10_PANVG|nr:hypothetical protein PVAP13_6KG065210 [Panicum virgatum]